MKQLVQVDDKFARFGSKSYAINKINSVEVRETHPHGRAAMLGWGLLALACLLSFVGSLSALEGPSFGTVLLAILFSGFAYMAWLRSQTVEYQLFLMTSSSEAQAFVTRDRDEVQRLRTRIEDAIAAS